MAHRGLSENYVTEAALLYLERMYKTQRNALSVQRKTEAWIAAKHGERYRADGLIIWATRDGEIRTASLEAKSHRTRHDVKVRYHDGVWFLQGVCVALVVGLLCWRMTMNADHWALRWAIPIGVGLIAGIVDLRLTGAWAFKSPDAVRQVRRYPADEQWLALSGDLYNLLTDSERKEIRALCDRCGVGILIVKRKQQIIVEQEAKSRERRPRGGFHLYYRGIDPLVQALENDVKAAAQLDDAKLHSAASIDENQL